MSIEEIGKIQELVYELQVREAMTEGVIKVTPSTPMRDLRQVLRDNRISGTPVVHKGALLGMVSMEDFINWLAEGGANCAVADRMTKNVTTVYEDEPLIQAVNKLERFGFGRLPVLNRRDRTLAGVITKGDIMVGLLRKLEIGFLQVEKIYERSSHIFEDVVADKKALILEYRVDGGNFDRAGTSASELKATLRHLGLPAQHVRRAAIAAYEAEMNLTFYTEGGRIKARVDPEILRLEVNDDGPGIADVEEAMRPGFSTAPDWVRELGFGAGMGLGNIQRCADRFSITSVVGKGTRLKVIILLRSDDAAERDCVQASA